MSAQSEFIAALEKGDVREVRRIGIIINPHLPHPSMEQAEASMHMARTQLDTLPLKGRAYSHRWLLERDLPSQLPDDLRPSAERLYPVIVEAVLVSCNTNSDVLKPAAKIVQAAVCDTVEDMYANGDRDPALVRARMDETRRRTWKQLIGVD